MSRHTRVRRAAFGSVAVTLLAGLLWLGCGPDQRAPTAPDVSILQQDLLRPAMAAQDRHTPELMSLPGVVGTATGLTEGGQPAILVLAERPGVTGVPASLDGYPVRVEVTGPITALQQGRKCSNPPCGGGGGGGGGGGKGGGNVDPTGYFARPVPIGVSTGNAGSCSAGTISARVKSGSSVYALSNNHVYALENTAKIGSEVLQPGLYDTNCFYDQSNHLGSLSKLIKIDFSGGTNTVDAAIALTSTGELGNSTPSDGYGTPSSTTVSAAVGMNVQKYGRTTGLTHGQVTGVNVNVNVGYSSGTAYFVDQIMVQAPKGPFSKAGDSGSLIVTDDNNVNPVGLLFAGSRNGTTFANPIGAVLGALGVTIDGK